VSMLAERAVSPQAGEMPVLPRRPVPHETGGRRPQPQEGRPHPQLAGQPTAARRVEDAEARALLADWFGEYAPMVQGVVARTVHHGDLDLVEDLAQDVWVEAWQYLLRGNTVARPAGLLAQKARRRVRAHYRSARVRRERVTDPASEAMDRIVAVIERAADDDACVLCGYWRCRCGGGAGVSGLAVSGIGAAA
jgi:Sigma-70 region 2